MRLVEFTSICVGKVLAREGNLADKVLNEFANRF